MPVVLWLLGLVTTVAGLLLVALAAGLRDGTFDSEILTPGMVGVVGGLLLVGLGMAVRELRRIERALAAPPLPRTERSADVISAEAPEAGARAPAPAAAKIEPKSDADRDGAAAPVVEDEALERLRAKFPSLVRRENGPAVHDADAAPLRLEVEEAIAAEVRNASAAVARAANGRARPPARLPPRPAAKTQHTSVAPGTTNGSAPSTFWPANPRRDDHETSPHMAAAPQSSPPVTVVTAETSSASEPELPGSDAPPAAASVTVLKSGVIEGMAYTLYSDGSIEAQLPQGTVRFGSISALRDHIEGAVQ